MRIGILFCGQGAQKVGMGKDFFDRYSIVQDLYLEADKQLGFPLSTISFYGPESELTKTYHCQPSLFVFGYALYTILRKEIPKLELVGASGLSLGELTAYATCGAFDYKTALKLVGERARLIQEASQKYPGTMVALIGSTRKLAESIAQLSGCQVANYNAADQQVLSGSHSSIAEAIKLAREAKIKKVIPLDVSGPFHSRYMEEASREFFELLTNLPLHIPSVPVIANATASIAQTIAELRQSLSKQICNPVRWEESLHFMLKLDIELFIEISPRKIFGSFLKRIDPAIRCLTISNVETIDELKNEL
ncbi:ACP S-malonyltransferase [Methylacidiphilum kamchatkense Kam1]|uniref:Malonyl CoA-acyl carrier protein transacylase n=1 Tax=Methylacidiphilum kamchatkense Kam1 TaxID=1202785 RepID=A0A0C1RL55_9BACT|nr:ACP S-malonyltransferase [Methylacidiphilum kamchatkense]KIE58762.1 ACP S-malonyltransferase [Methylacidiphilum kamchatkense Kam1]QDQ41838.1 [acyl-carrier-protein] S-malonyltransferase [Methylacidiphilum kamchatkense Kam1]